MWALSIYDSSICGVAVVALQVLGKVSGLGVRAFHKSCNTATLHTQRRIAALSIYDSSICGVAVVALQVLGKVSGLGVRAFHKSCNTATLHTQRRIAQRFIAQD